MNTLSLIALACIILYLMRKLIMPIAGLFIIVVCAWYLLSQWQTTGFHFRMGNGGISSKPFDTEYEPNTESALPLYDEQKQDRTNDYSGGTQNDFYQCIAGQVISHSEIVFEHNLKRNNDYDVCLDGCIFTAKHVDVSYHGDGKSIDRHGAIKVYRTFQVSGSWVQSEKSCNPMHTITVTANKTAR